MLQLYKGKVSALPQTGQCQRRDRVGGCGKNEGRRAKIDRSRMCSHMIDSLVFKCNSTDSFWGNCLAETEDDYN